MAKSSRMKVEAGTPQKGKHNFSAEVIVSYENKPPIFSLERLQSGRFCLSNMDKDHKAAFADAIYKRKSTSWRDLKSMDRHALGFEKISKTSIKAALPPSITPEADNLLAFRLKGKASMVGYRVKDVFYILWFDPYFKLYDH